MAGFRKHDPSFSNNTPNMDPLMVLKLGWSDRRTIAGVRIGHCLVALLNWDRCFLGSSRDNLGQKSDGIQAVTFRIRTVDGERRYAYPERLRE
jgi:hypothetical protein